MVVSDNTFLCFPYISRFKICDPRGGIEYDPRSTTLSNLVEVRKMMLHTKYQGSKPGGFRQEDGFMYSIYKPIEYMGQVWHLGIT